MRILDKYILKQYLISFIIIQLSFSILFIIIDVFDRLPRILRYSNDILLISQYFLLRLPYLFVLISPIVVLLAGLFLMSNLSKHNESIAIRGAGISVLRMVMPLFILGLFISCLVSFFGEIVLPKAENRRTYIYNVQMKHQEIEDVKMRSNIYYSDDKYLYYLGFFDGYQSKIKVIDITEINDEGKIVRKIQANEAVWDSDYWVFINTHDRQFKNGHMNIYEYFDRKILPEITVTPQDFIKSAKTPMQMNYQELNEYIIRLKKIGEKYHSELIDLYMKISFPLANFVILLFCVPLATASVRSRGRGVIFLFGLLICFTYLMTIRISQSLGYNELLNPITAAWLPHLVFFFIGIGFVIKSEI